MNVEPGSVHVTDDAFALGTEPIPARYYFDPEWYEMERKSVWLRSWLNVGHICELPESGSFIRRELEFAKASLVIVRGKDGEIRAFHNACTHRGTQLVAAEAGRQATFRCPYHMWTFGGDGRLISAPDFERFYVSKRDCSLRPVAVEVCGGLIFVCLDARQSLREYLGSMAGMLEQIAVAQATTFHQYTYEINANWKLTYDNFQENYHLRFIHSNTIGPTLGSDNPFGYPSGFSLHGQHRTQTIWMNPEAEMSEAMTMSFGRGLARIQADGLFELPHGNEYVALFPNFFLLCNPANHFLHTVYPLGPERSRGVIRLYWKGEDEIASVRYAREFTMASTRDVHAEDVAVIEAGQRGLSSGAIKQVNFMEQEILCRHLVKVVEQAVEKHRAETAAA